MKTNIVKCEAKTSVETKITKIKKTFGTKKRKNRKKKYDKKIFLEQRYGRHIGQSHSRTHEYQSNDNLNPGKIWQNAYNNVIRWQCEQQVRFWKNLALKYKAENEELRRQLESQDSSNTHETETQESTNDSVDEQFISFLEITAKHRMERFSQRTQEGRDSS